MSDVSKFNILGQIINIKDTIARNTIATKSDELTNLINTKTGELTNSINSEVTNRVNAINDLKKILFINDLSRVLTVGTNGAKYKTINEAITHGLTLSPTKNNPITILISPGTYTEQIVLNNVHGINFVGFGIDNTIIQFNGAYPNCVVHVQGDVSFRHLTIKQLNSSAYTVHCDPVDTMVEGTVAIEHCKITGGSDCVGYGSGQNTELYIKDCILEASNNILYAHNSPYARTGQKLTVLDNIFVHGSESNYLYLDDAGFSNGGTLSPMLVVFNGNTYTNVGIGSMKFRKNTASSETKSYLPHNDNNIIVPPCNDNNSAMPGVNYHEGLYEVNQFVVLPASANTAGYIDVTIPVTVNALAYNRELVNVTLPGVGSVKDSFTISNVMERGINLTTQNASLAGKSVSVQINLTVV